MCVWGGGGGSSVYLVTKYNMCVTTHTHTVQRLGTRTNCVV